METFFGRILKSNGRTSGVFSEKKSVNEMLEEALEINYWRKPHGNGIMNCFGISEWMNYFCKKCYGNP